MHYVHRTKIYKCDMCTLFKNLALVHELGSKFLNFWTFLSGVDINVVDLYLEECVHVAKSIVIALFCQIILIFNENKK